MSEIQCLGNDVCSMGLTICTEKQLQRMKRVCITAPGSQKVGSSDDPIAIIQIKHLAF